MSKPEPSLFDEIDDDAEAAADARAEADIAAGRVISHEAMKRWLLSWGTLEEGPAPSGAI
jgi:predicted transcriptional regulator